MLTEKHLCSIAVLFFLLCLQQCYVLAQVAHLPPGWDKTVCIIQSFRPGVVEKGTGFFVADNSDSLRKFDTVLVTNKHVVQDADSINIKYYDLNLGIREKTLHFTSLEQRLVITEHPDPAIDIVTISLDFKIKVNAYLTSNFRNFEKLDLSEEVYFFGYPLGISVDGPILRKGIVSYKSAEALKLGHRNMGSMVKGGVFLVDGFAWQGNSGSPVVSQTYFLPELGLKQIPFSLVGIVFAFAYASTPDSTNSGLAIALPANRIREVIDASKGR